MKLNVIRNTKRNLMWGATLKIYQILVPMVIRWLFIYRLGVEYAGLGGLFSSVLNFLNLAEMGVGSAVLFFLYKPIAQNDTEAVRSLLGLVRRCYRWIGLVILVIGLAITPFIRSLISGTLPAGINIYVIFLMNLLSVVLSYWLFAYKDMILLVHQRNDLMSRIQLGTQTTRYLAQIVVLLSVENYYIYLAVDIAVKLIERMVTILVVNRKYPMYRETSTPTRDMSKALRGKVKALILHKIGGIIVNSADTVVISMFLGLTVLGKYLNYYQVMTMVLGFVFLINSSTQAGIGNRVATGNLAEDRRLFKYYNFFIFVVCSVCCSCFLNLYQPFITLWLGRGMLLDNGIVAAFCAYFYVFLLMQPGNMFENVSGLWQHDRYRPFLEGMLNLALNLVLVRFIGLYGILLSTIISMLFLSIPWLYYNVSKHLLQGGFLQCMRDMILHTVVLVAICTASYLLCGLVPAGTAPIAELLVKGMVSVIVPSALLYCLYHRSEEWKWMCGIGRRMLGSASRQDRTTRHP